MTIIKMLNDSRNKMKRKKMLKSKRIKETKRGTTEGTKFWRDFFEGTEKEGEEKNSSSTQAKWGRREKSSLTTQENFWCVKLWGMRALFIGEEVDENGTLV